MATDLAPGAGSDAASITALTTAARPRIALWQVVVLGSHAAMLVWVVSHHEPWFDEAQAWLLARDASVYDLIVKYPRYEGSPALWHLILAVPAKLGAPYITLQILSGAGAFLTAVLIVVRSPFPPWMRAALPFSYWLFYQYGVVARSYVLLGPLLFILATVWPTRRERPVRILVLLLLLANVSFHGFLIAGGVMAVQTIELRRTWAELSPRQRRLHVGAQICLGVMAAALFVQLRPPPDASFVSARDFHFRVDDAWRAARKITQGGFTGSGLTLLLGVIPTLVFLKRSRGVLLWLLPTAAVIAFSVIRYFNIWHQGVLVLIWIFALWCAWTPTAERSQRGPGRWSAAALAAMTIVVAVQLSWTAHSVHYDIKRPYSGAAATARYLKPIVAAGGRINTRSIESVSVQPYFKSNIFANYDRGRGGSYWWWSTRADLHPTPELLITNHPDAIVYGDKQGGLPEPLVRPAFPGYHVGAYLRGALFLKDRFFEQDGFWVFVPDEARR
ncbi:MAG: hypothetical protein H0U92_10120 [Actinobacteria bacterium]|nr:hypothetical protein [Actinomycetota bacterium]